MTSLTTALPVGYECAAGGRDVAQEGFRRHLRYLDARARQDIVDSDIRASTVHDSPRLHDLKIRRARVLQEIADKGLKSSSSGVSAWRLEMRREKIQRARYRRYFANEKLKSSNLGLKTRRAHARQRLVDIDLECDRLFGSGG